MKTISLILALSVFGSCATQTVYLHQLRAGEAGSEEALVYDEIQKAVALANEFLANSKYAKGFPAESAHFDLGLSNIILRLENEYDLIVAIETSYWGDLRFLFGADVQASDHGIIAAHRPDYVLDDDITDNEFFHLHFLKMAGTLLRQSVVMREIQARGELDFWLNYKLLGIDPGRGWNKNSHVYERANLTEKAFLLWYREQKL
ncbi:MAG: hypothetical protein H8E25_15505 [Planctomycetes bacterium]|nr:hypothetical protein [Planctomycetota bacterium]